MVGSFEFASFCGTSAVAQSSISIAVCAVVSAVSVRTCPAAPGVAVLLGLYLLVNAAASF